MEITVVLAEQFVADLAVAEQWYAKVFGRAPDVRPMDGLLEWHLNGGGGIQVYEDAERAGGTAVTLGVTSIADVVTELDAAGVEHGEPWGATSFRVLELTDPDGNGLVLTEPLAAG